MELDKQFSKFYEYIGLRQDIDAVDKILLTKIISLSKSKQGCYITNNSLKLYTSLADDKRISRRLSNLEKRGFIKIHYHDDKRYITPLVSKDTLPLSQETHPLVSKDNPPLSQETNNKINDNIIDKITRLDTSNNTGETYIEEINNAQTEFARNTHINYIKRIAEGTIPKNKKQLEEYNKCKRTMQLITISK